MFEPNSITDTSGLLTLALDARGSNRSVRDLDAFAAELDPEGSHLCVFRMLHNDTEWRTLWWCKTKHSVTKPFPIWLDVSFTAYETCSSPMPEGLCYDH